MYEYRRDNREKVEEDEQILNEAKKKWAQNHRSNDLNSKIGSLKNANVSIIHKLT